MSLKWQRSKRWDDEHFPAWAWPAKAVLRAFSSIPLAVCLLSFVVVYATLASVPIGLLVLGLTYLFYAATLGVAIGVVAIMPSVLVWLSTRRRVGWGARFSLTMASVMLLGVLSVWLWWAGVWPLLRYEPTTGSGVRFFADFVEAYESTTLRRLPGIEMTEIEFYSAWPLKLVLFAFVINMVTATVRRIEFIFPNIGVLTVHSGIVVMALGSIYYAGLKQEGLAVVRAGAQVSPTQRPGIGPPTRHFYDHIDVSLYLDQGRGWEQRVLDGVPRYNDYNLDVVGGATLSDTMGRPEGAERADRPLSIDVPDSRADRIDDELSFEIVGYASYAEPADEWVRAEPPADPSEANPVRVVRIHTPTGDADESRPAFSFALQPRSPAQRATANRILDVEYRIDTPAQRWEDVTAPVPPGTRHALVIEVPEAGHRSVHAIMAGQTVEVGETGYLVTAEQFMPQPPFPIITPGYEGATSAVAVLRITKPDGTKVQRWAYHRFPGISQDFDEPAEPGQRPQRSPADPAIRIAYLDDTHPQIHIDESEAGIRVAIREPRSGVRVIEDVDPGALVEDIFQRVDPETEPRIDLALGPRWDHARQITVPRVVPEEARNPQAVGTHAQAMVAVRVSDDAGWSETVWLQATDFPLARFGAEHEAQVVPPGRRPLRIMFGGRQRPLPGFAVQLVDFEMISYEHRGAPRDYQSTVRVTPTGDSDFEQYTHLAKLNAPLQAPFMWDEDRPLPANVWGKLASRLNPHQFKLSQARWDASGWEQTQQLADQGRLDRPFARWTILGVGNNPGIHIIALGAIMVGVGTPWAFYVKPMIMRARKRRIQARLASEPIERPNRRARAPQPVGAEI